MHTRSIATLLVTALVCLPLATTAVAAPRLVLLEEATNWS
jgi:hypothetical protein